MEKITCLTDNNEPVVFFVLEQTRINGKNYLLVTDVEDENVDADAYILKDESQDSDSEASYVIVDDMMNSNMFLRYLQSFWMMWI